MKTRNILTLILFSMMVCFNMQAQQSFNGLVKVAEKELEDKLAFKKDIEDLSFYNLDGNVIEIDQAESLLASHKYFPEFYMNKNKEVEAVMIKKMSDETPSAQTKFKSLRIFKAENEKNNLGKKSVDFSAVDMNDKSYVLSELKGKVVVMNFWFIQCKPCVNEMPGLNKIVEKYENNEDVVFLAFSWDKKSNIESFLKKYRFLYNIIPQSNKIVSSYGIGSFPTNMIIDQNGNTVYKETGLHINTIIELENKIASLIE